MPNYNLKRPTIKDALTYIRSKGFAATYSSEWNEITVSGIWSNLEPFRAHFDDDDKAMSSMQYAAYADRHLNSVIELKGLRTMGKNTYIVFSQENETNRVCHITIHRSWESALKEVKRRNKLDSSVWHGIRYTDTVADLKERGF